MAVAELDIEPRTRGRAAIPLTVEYVRDVTEADLALLASERGVQAPTVKKLRDRHHALARALATGATNAEASQITGYDPSRISILLNDPSFQELLAQYRELEGGLLAEFSQRAGTLTLTALNEIQDRLEESPEDFSISTLIEVGKTFADRTGHAPVQKTVNANVNIDLGSRLAKARERAASLRTVALPAPDE